MAYQLNKTYLLFSNSGSGRCLNVSGNTVANNRNVCILNKNGSAAQNWMVKAFGSNLKIVTGLNQNYALNYYWSSGQGKAGNCDIYPQSGNDADSSIVLEPVSTDVYRIKLKNYNLYLTAKGTGDNADVRWEAPVSLSSGYSLLAPQEWRFLDPAEKGIRAPFIYAGFHESGTEYEYTDTQLTGLGNATEFVICSGNYGEYFDSNGKPNSNGSIQKYVVAAAERAKSLYTMYGKQVWIGTPMVGSNVTFSKATFEEVGRRMTYFIDNIITQFNLIGLNFNTVVKGIYMGDEGIIGKLKAYASENDGTLVSDHIQVQMFQTVSNYAASKGKKMLWSPYWDNDNLVNAAIVIHQTNIFDYALIQPHYYFITTGTGSVSDSGYYNCEALRAGIAIQRVLYSNTGFTIQPILHESAITCTKTVISCQMEIDQNYASNVNYQKRYKRYEDIFNQAYGAYDKYTADFGFYFECPWSTADPEYTTIKTVVNNFFK